MHLLYISFCYLLLIGTDGLGTLQSAEKEVHLQNGTFYSGLVQINSTTGSNMFYWYLPPLNGNKSAPLILWLQGGPGSSGFLGALVELGPYQLDLDSLTLSPRNITWNQNYALLFVDSPVGTGYSFTEEEEGYAKSEEDVARDLYSLLLHFYASFPEAQANDFYIAGESYGGHYVPSLADYILKHNTSPVSALQFQIPLKGIAIGDGFTHPPIQVLTKPLSAYNFGLLNYNQYLQAFSYAEQASQSANNGDYLTALKLRQMMEAIVAATGINLYDVRTFDQYKFDEAFNIFLNRPEIKHLFNVPPTVTFGTSPKVELYLEGDVMKSLIDRFPFLLSKIKVLLYQGQFDWKDGVTSNEPWISIINWPGRDGYLKATRSPWFINNRPAGFSQSFGPLTEVVIAGAGHLSPMNQPERAYDMINRFIQDIPFS